jgi:hypothetical protein
MSLHEYAWAKLADAAIARGLVMTLELHERAGGPQVRVFRLREPGGAALRVWTMPADERGIDEDAHAIGRELDWLPAELRVQ